MAAGSPSRTAKRAAATREVILVAAEGLLEEGGPAALTLEALATRADVAVQTVYNRIGGRAAVLIAVAERALEENRQYMDAAYLAEGTPKERVVLAALAYARFAAERPLQFRLLADPPDVPDALERIADLVQEQNAKLSAAIGDGIIDGSVRPDVDAELAATALWAMMNGLLALGWRADRLRADPDRLGAMLLAVTDMLTEGLTPRT